MAQLTHMGSRSRPRGVPAPHSCAGGPRSPPEVRPVPAPVLGACAGWTVAAIAPVAQGDTGVTLSRRATGRWSERVASWVMKETPTTSCQGEGLSGQGDEGRGHPPPCCSGTHRLQRQGPVVLAVEDVIHAPALPGAGGCRVRLPAGEDRARQVLLLLRRLREGPAERGHSGTGMWWHGDAVAQEHGGMGTGWNGGTGTRWHGDMVAQGHGGMGMQRHGEVVAQGRCGGMRPR